LNFKRVFSGAEGSGREIAKIWTQSV
jgi:hypothetical protein